MRNLGLRPWAIIGPGGPQYVGLHEDEASTWSTALGWPSTEEIEEKKRRGWYAVPVTLQWEKPDGTTS